MDILSLQPGTKTLVLKSPATGLPLGIDLELISLEDARVKAVERTIKNKALRGGRNSITAEKIDANTDEILAASVVGWRWYKPVHVEANGKAEAVYGDEPTLGGVSNPPFNKQNLLALISVRTIAKQIDDEQGDEASFFAKSPPSSGKS